MVFFNNFFDSSDLLKFSKNCNVSFDTVSFFFFALFSGEEYFCIISVFRDEMC